MFLFYPRASHIHVRYVTHNKAEGTEMLALYSLLLKKYVWWGYMFILSIIQGWLKVKFSTVVRAKYYFIEHDNKS